MISSRLNLSCFITRLLLQAKRRISSIVGAVVADAASLPLEWIYKDATMKVNNWKINK